MSENRFDTVRELVKDPSLRVTEIAWKTGYNKGHVSRLRKEAIRQALEEKQKTAVSPDGGTGFIDGVWHEPGPTAWRCQCGKPYTVTCISSKPAKREWVGLTDEDMEALFLNEDGVRFARYIEAKLKEKNT
jgi:hypothetical protein